MSSLQLRRYWTALGAVLSLSVVWLVPFLPESFQDRLAPALRPYELFIWFGIAFASIVFSLIAARKISRWWLIMFLLAILTFLYIFNAEMA